MPTDILTLNQRWVECPNVVALLHIFTQVKISNPRNYTRVKMYFIISFLNDLRQKKSLYANSGVFKDLNEENF